MDNKLFCLKALFDSADWVLRSFVAFFLSPDLLLSEMVGNVC
jgi:hypothetical protein